MSHFEHYLSLQMKALCLFISENHLLANIIGLKIVITLLLWIIIYVYDLYHHHYLQNGHSSIVSCTDSTSDQSYHNWDNSEASFCTNSNKLLFLAGPAQ